MTAKVIYGPTPDGVSLWCSRCNAMHPHICMDGLWFCRTCFAPNPWSGKGKPPQAPPGMLGRYWRTIKFTAQILWWAVRRK